MRRERPSPNQDDRPPDTPIDCLILHYTGMRSAEAALDRLCDPAAGVSSHYVVEEDGLVWSLVPEARRAFHAGVSSWQGDTALNGRSVGIEIVNPGHEHGYRRFRALQLAAVCELCLEVLARHPIPPARVVGHSDVAPDRKQDPGELFPWAEFAAEGVGLWPADMPPPGVGDSDGGVAGDVRQALRRIGYAAEGDGGWDPALATVLRAFQRHWRPEMIHGRADAGTRARLEAVRAVSPT